MIVTSATARAGLRIADLPVGRALPVLDAVVVVIAVEAARGDERVACRLRVAGFVGGAALQVGGCAVPLPTCFEARCGLALHGTLQTRVAPGLTAVHRHFHARDATAAGPCQAADRIKAGACQVLSRRGPRDH